MELKVIQRRKRRDEGKREKGGEGETRTYGHSKRE